MHPLIKIGTSNTQPIDGQAARAVGMVRGSTKPEHEDAKEGVIGEIKQLTFVLDGHRYKFKWTLKDFAKANSLAVNDQTEKEFVKINDSARMDMRVITDAVRCGTVRRVQYYLKGIGRVRSSSLTVNWTVDRERLKCEICEDD